jgi:hypothetical protein
MSLYEASVPQLKKMLVNADKWLEAAVEHAKAKPFDPEHPGSARLAPDAYLPTRQIQAIADGAVLARRSRAKRGRQATTPRRRSTVLRARCLQSRGRVP